MHRSVSAQVTSRPRAGRRFEPTHELALLDDAINACAGLPGAHRGVSVIAEMSGPFGIPDMTALVGPTETLHARMTLSIPPILNEIDAGIIGVAHDKQGRSSTLLAQKLGWPVDTIARRIPGLVRSGALIETRQDRYVRPAQLQALGRVYAVEAKVRDWRRALRQVRTYSAWADSYVLVMGSLPFTALEQLKPAVLGDGGGLLVDGRWQARPRLHTHPPGRRLWASEHYLVAAMSQLPALGSTVES